MRALFPPEWRRLRAFSTLRVVHGSLNTPAFPYGALQEALNDGCLNPKTRVEHLFDITAISFDDSKPIPPAACGGTTIQTSNVSFMFHYHRNCLAHGDQ